MQEDQGEATEYFQSMLTAQDGMDVKRDKSELKIFSNSKPIISQEFEDSSFFTNKTNLEDKEKAENDNALNKNIIHDIDDIEDDSDDNEDAQGNEDNKNYFEEKVESDGRIRRKVIFKDELDDDSTTEKESDTDSDEDNTTGTNRLEFRGLNQKKDLDIKSKITEVLNKLELKDSKPNEESKLDSSFEESGIEMELEDYKNQEKRKNSFSDSEEERKKVKRKKKDDSSDDGEDSDEEDYEMVDVKKEKNNAYRSFKSDEDSEDQEDDNNDADDDGEDDEDDDYDASAVKWKDNLAQKAEDAFVQRQNSTHNLYKLVYGLYQILSSIKRLLNIYFFFQEILIKVQIERKMKSKKMMKKEKKLEVYFV